MTPNSSYEYRSSYSSTTSYGDARYNAYSDRTRCCHAPRSEPYDSYRAYRDDERYEAPRRDYDDRGPPPRDRYDRY